MENGRADVLVKMNLNKMYSSFLLESGLEGEVGAKKIRQKAERMIVAKVGRKITAPPATFSGSRRVPDV